MTIDQNKAANILKKRSIEQLEHNHDCNKLQKLQDRFKGCGCGWCYICDNPPHECLCNVEPSYRTITAQSARIAELEAALKKTLDTLRIYSYTEYLDAEAARALLETK